MTHRSAIPPRRLGALALALLVGGVSGPLAPANLASAQVLSADGLDAPAPNAPAGWLGVAVEWDDARDAVRIRNTVVGSPARAAGVPDGATIRSVDGRTYASVEAFIEHIRACGEGQTIQLVVGPEDAPRPFEITLAARPSTRGMSQLLEGVRLPLMSVEDARTGLASPILAANARLTVIEFWATWCGPCREVRPRMVAMHERYADSGLNVVAITGEASDEVRAYALEHPMPFRVGTDPDRLISSELLAMLLPTWYVVDAEGIVLRVFSGSNRIDDLEAFVREQLAQQPAPQP
jgi:thiol-disulfide isomerase/thioredoxin